MIKPKSDFEKLVIAKKYIGVLKYSIGELESENDELKYILKNGKEPSDDIKTKLFEKDMIYDLNMKIERLESEAKKRKVEINNLLKKNKKYKDRIKLAKKGLLELS